MIFLISREGIRNLRRFLLNQKGRVLEFRILSIRRFVGNFLMHAKALDRLVTGNAELFPLSMNKLVRTIAETLLESFLDETPTFL